jgi:UDP-N-acetylglucosamine 2-epimerase (non-hydrolysing)
VIGPGGHVLHVVGARPNFMKAAAVVRALSRREGLRQSLVHTGQHYDAQMNDVFFRELELPAPTVNLEVGAGSHAQQTGLVMQRLEPELLELAPDLVLVYGDVNSTLASALVCAKLRIPLGHVEAGLRAFDRDMPEEINRIVTDRLADILFTPSPEADANLRAEGVAADAIHFVGNVMIDTLVRLTDAARARRAELPRILHDAGMSDPDALQRFGLVTLHRPSNVDAPARLARLLEALVELSADVPLIFPAHPRTRRQLLALGEMVDAGSLHVIGPLGYLDFLALQRDARLVITDSGGVQEESTFLGVPCLTVRSNTERPVTVSVGTNVLVGDDVARLKAEARRALAGRGRPGRLPELWDGHAGERIARVLCGTLVEVA